MSEQEWEAMESVKVYRGNLENRALTLVLSDRVPNLIDLVAWLNQFDELPLTLIPARDTLEFAIQREINQVAKELRVEVKEEE